MAGDSIHIGLLVIRLYLPGASSLKHKRSLLRPLLAALHKRFNVSAAETGANDYHQSAVIACTLASNSSRHIQPVFENILRWVETSRPDLQIVDSEISML